jgi:serine/threonine protein kinase
MKTQVNAGIEPFTGTPGEVLVSDRQRSYLVDNKIGKGGFADVYRVHNRAGEVFALKLLRMWMIQSGDRAEVLKRFEREISCSNIHSRYLVRFYDKGTHLGNPFLLMEFCPGGNLGDLIGQPVAGPVYRNIAVRILKGLQDLHQAGIIHRDLKPVNVLFNGQGEALLTDFGISGYLQSRITVRNWLGHVKKIFGTVVYMPPEQLNEKQAFLSLGPVTDVFAFGVTIHQLITRGELPYGSYPDSEEQEYVQRLLTGNWIGFTKTRKDMPDLWAEIIEGCIQPDPAKRFQQVSQILALLDIRGRIGAPASGTSNKKGQYLLRVMEGQQHGLIYNLSELCRQKDCGILTLGWLDNSNPNSNDIGIAEAGTNFISRFHCSLEFNAQEGQWYIRDGQWRSQAGTSDWFLSTNGVLVNSNEIDAEGFPLNPGDIVTLGDTTLRFECI